ncbi:MAG: D-alanine--D-alanine ligase [Parvibaculales bacterium]
MSQFKHIAVLMGGWSAERDISLQSGKNCAAALQRLGFEVSEIDAGRDIAQRLAELKPDCVLNCLHGTFGEDGVIQGVLEILELPYTHSGVLASSLAMDKIKAKYLFKQLGLPVAPDMLISKANYQTHPMQPPYVVKPINEGSSVGVYLVDENAPVPEFLNLENWPFDGDAMLETYVPGREFTCGVMGDEALEVMEIVPSEGFYDFTAKYTDGICAHILPAQIPDQLAEEIKNVSLAAHQALGCRGVSRSDFRYDENGLGLILLEINTQPGMTDLSLVPEMAAYRGISYDELVQWMVEDASCQR